MGTKKRDAAYWRGRLDREFPDLAAKLDAGEIASVRAAAIEAGLIRDPTPYHELRRAWRKATKADRKAFLEELATETAELAMVIAPPAPAPEPPPVPPPPVPDVATPEPPAPARKGRKGKARAPETVEVEEPAPPSSPAAPPVGEAAAGMASLLITIPDLVRQVVRAVYPPDKDFGEDPDEVAREFISEISSALHNVIDYGAEWSDEPDLTVDQKSLIEGSLGQLQALLGDAVGKGLTGVEVAARLKKAGISSREAASVAGITQQAMKAILADATPLKAHARNQIEPLLRELRDYES